MDVDIQLVKDRLKDAFLNMYSADFAAAEVTIEGLLGITLNNEHIVLVNVHENLSANLTETKVTTGKTTAKLAGTKRALSRKTARYGGVKRTKLCLDTTKPETNNLQQSENLTNNSDELETSFEENPNTSLEKVCTNTEERPEQEQPESKPIVDEDSVEESSFPEQIKPDSPALTNHDKGLNMLEKLEEAKVEKDIVEQAEPDTDIIKTENPVHEDASDSDQQTSHRARGRAAKNFDCHLCSSVFYSHCSLKRHVKQKHNNCAASECSHCGNRFVTPYELEKHSREHASWQKKPYQCDKCPLGFSRRSALIQHKAMRHLVESSILHLCKICGKKFGQRSHLNEHLQKHVKGGRHQCAHCRCNFTHSRSLRRHQEKCKAPAEDNDAVTPGRRPNAKGCSATRVSQCEQCGKVFLSPRYLMQHMQKHDNPAYCCSKCNKRFTWKTTYQRHIAKCRETKIQE